MCLLMCTNRQSMRWDVTSGLVGGMMYHYTIATEPRTMIGHDLEGSGGDAGCRGLPERKGCRAPAVWRCTVISGGEERLDGIRLPVLRKGAGAEGAVKVGRQGVVVRHAGPRGACQDEGRKGTEGGLYEGPEGREKGYKANRRCWREANGL
jgi:hypothetical protein